MPNLVVRVSDTEMVALEAAAGRAGQSRSDYVREALTLRETVPDLAETIRALIERSNHAIFVGSVVDDMQARLSALEMLARGEM